MIEEALQNHKDSEKQLLKNFGQLAPDDIMR